MSSELIDPATLPTMSFDWGVIKPLVAGVSDNVSLMHVVLLPGQGHERHNHPDADEILYVLGGAGEQMVDDDHDLRRPPRPHGLDPEGRVPLDRQHGLGTPRPCSRSTPQAAPRTRSRASRTTANSPLANHPPSPAERQRLTENRQTRGAAAATLAG